MVMSRPRYRVVTLPSPWQILADRGVFSHGERPRWSRPSTAKPVRAPHSAEATMKRGAR